MTDPAITVVQSGGYGQASSIFLRGAESDQALVLRDSVRLNSATSGAASLPFIDTTDIKQIEVLKGPASVLYGTDAIGGVVQLITKHQLKTVLSSLVKWVKTIPIKASSVQTSPKTVIMLRFAVSV